MNKLSTFLLLAAALSSCQKTAPIPGLATPGKGQIVRYDLTYDEHNQAPRLRWIVQLAAPLSAKGWNNQDYTQVKVFDLPDTVTFRVGTKLSFTYQLVPQDQQTPWKTNYEWYSVPAYPPGYIPYPELALAEIQRQ
ncbi:hypothetical protein [Hymenobacter terricola]|uniref:hypothetical protein n=1 Tax=Hymenobacter terricola TaxID=2819236 RepID=UPI001B303362|nr:hypothetical protein [Hymenobacter terricola]